MEIKDNGSIADKQAICEQAALLGDMILQSMEYRQYQEARDNLQRDKEQSYILSKLRNQQMSLRLAQILGGDLGDVEEDFEDFYAAFCLEPVICDFLYAEGRLGRLISEVQQICGEKLELWNEIETTDILYNRDLN